MPAEHVPGVPSEIERTFLMERLLEAYRQVMEDVRRAQEDGGAMIQIQLQLRIQFQIQTRLRIQTIFRPRIYMTQGLNISYSYNIVGLFYHLFICK